MKSNNVRKQFFVLLIKPSRYDDDGYVVQWYRSVFPSNTLVVVNSLVEDCAKRQVLGTDIEIIVEAYDDQCSMPSIKQFAKRMKGTGAGSLVCLAGIHSAMFPRAADIARRFRSFDIPVVMGGFHISGVIAMVPEITPELQEMLDIGVSLFSGEVEERFERVLKDAYNGSMPPIYNYLNDLVDLNNTPPSIHLPKKVEEKLALFLDPINTIEAGRGCPFHCSFCTIINVHGHKARMHSGKEIAEAIRQAVKHGRNRFMFTDDNMSRNQNWRDIFIELTKLREEEGLDFTLVMQVDTQSDNDPDFIPMAVRAGTRQVFVGMESVNPDTLEAMGKKHNMVKHYQSFFLKWKRSGVMTAAGFIIGYPNDTKESVYRDIKYIQKELCVDILYPFILTPLPGSADHAALWKQGVKLDPDLSRYTTFHSTKPHPNMSSSELEALFLESWKKFYTSEHIVRILRRHIALGADLDTLTPYLFAVSICYEVEKIHPLELGLFRLKSRVERDPKKPREAVLPFYIRRGIEVIVSQLRWGRQFIRMFFLIRKAIRLQKDKSPDINDPALFELK